MNCDSRRRRSPSPAAYLPDDLLVEILTRLPAKSLCRFKSVSRTWRDLISNPANRFRFAQTLSGLFFFHPDHRARPPWRFCGFSSPERDGGLSTVDTALSFLPSTSYSEMELLDSCNGLLLLRCSCSSRSRHGRRRTRTTTSTRFYVVCNPATKSWVVLPQPSYAPGESRAWCKNTCNAALGFDPAVSPHFHVFQLVQHDDQCYDYVEAVDIYSSDTGRWALWKSRWSEHYMNIYFAKQMTYLNGVMHLATIYDNAVASVDVKGQSWKVTPAPLRVKDGCGRIAQSQGRLLFVHHDYPGDALAIYVLDDNEDQQSSSKEEWTLKRRISMADLLFIGPRDSPRRQGYSVIAFHPHSDSIIFYDPVADPEKKFR
ncbi:unnamed protein product [Urochloa decumbens]|uniref:F-box domain-containing protein n=1 Tax=Urochloa decumbens TaxID=240449 RepID=A0ABC8WKP2_9POAL